MKNVQWQDADFPAHVTERPLSKLCFIDQESPKYFLVYNRPISKALCTSFYSRTRRREHSTVNVGQRSSASLQVQPSFSVDLLYKPEVR